jgi:hypothetical protein
MAILNFNAAAVAPQMGFEPVPAGWYNVKIVGSEMKPTKAGDGSYLELTLEVLDGTYANRKLFHRLNIENKNPVAVNIAYSELSAIGHVTGVIQIGDSQMLHNIPFQIRVTVKAASGDYDASNEIKGYRDRNGRDAKDCVAGAAAAVAVGAPVAPTAPTAPAAPVVPTRPTDPTHIAPNPAGGELWWSGTAWVEAPAAPAAPPVPVAPAAPPAPPAAPAAPETAAPAPPWTNGAPAA